MNTTTKNLMFLLASAPMAISGCTVTLTTDAGNDETEAGSGDGDGDGDAETSTTASTGDGDGDATGDGDGDATGDGDGDPATGDGDGDATGDGDGDATGDGDGDATGDGDGDATGDGDGDATGDGDGDATTTGDGDGDPGQTTCEIWGEKYVECYQEAEYDAAYYQMYCEGYLGFLEEEYGEDCAAALEATFVCANGLSCDEFNMGPEACPAEFAAFMDACGFEP